MISGSVEPSASTIVVGASPSSRVYSHASSSAIMRQGEPGDQRPVGPCGEGAQTLHQPDCGVGAARRTSPARGIPKTALVRDDARAAAHIPSPP